MLGRAGHKDPVRAGMKAPLEIGSEDPGAWLEFQACLDPPIHSNMGSEGSYAFPCPWRETPLIESPALSLAAGCRVFCKLDNLQPAGSFKSRGIGNLIRQSILQKPPQTPIHFYCTSGGNAGLAAVVAARRYGYASTVVVPTTTSAAMIAKLRAAGATNVVQMGDSFMEADTWLKENLLANDPTGVYVSAYDHPWIWEGARSLIEEVNAQLHGDEPDAVVCSVGGGGLLCGIMQGIDQYNWKKTRVLAIETAGAESLHNSLLKGSNTTMAKISTIATSLGAKRVADAAFEYAQRKQVISAVLPDSHAAMGCWRFADDERLLIEPACGVSIATCYNGMLKKLLPDLTPESKVVIVVCGGSAISTEMLEEFRVKYADAEKVTEANPMVSSSYTAPIPG